MFKSGFFLYPPVTVSSPSSHSPGSCTIRSSAGRGKCTACNPYLRVFTGAILLVFLIFASPVSGGAIVNINNSSSIADALLNVGSGGTLILEPGIYFISSQIEISNSTTIKASTGHGPDDTIINARDSCRIFNNSGRYSLTVEGLTLRNGMVPGTAGGGAVYAGPGSTITLTSSRIFNCSANEGGAIYIDGGDTLSVTGSEFLNCSGYDSGAAIYALGSRDVTISESGFSDCAARYGTVYLQLIDNTITIASSNFTGCSGTIVSGAIALSDSTATITGSTFTNSYAYLGGGAIYAANSPLNVESSTFTSCTTNGGSGWGGAIYTYSTEDVTVTGSTFTGCFAGFDGGGINADSGNVSVVSSTFTNCSTIQMGGAVSTDSGSISIISSTFTSCSTYLGGGAVFTDSGDVSITSSTFTGCSAKDGSGGAVCRGSTGSSGSVTVTGSLFEGCTASCYNTAYSTSIYSGGAIFLDCYSTITVSTFANCSAYSGGGAVYANTSSTGSIHFSRIYNCSSGGTAVSSTGSIDAANNWWVTNTDPSGFVSGNVTVDPWLVLGATAAPASITTAQTSAIWANLNHNSNNEDKSGSGYVPDGITVSFTGTGGSVNPLLSATTNGAAATAFTPSAAGDAALSVTVDGVMVNVFITVIPASPGRTSGSSGGSNTNTGVGASGNLHPGEYASFTFEGKGAVDGLFVTVSKETPKIMITVKSRNSIPSSLNEPGTDVYEYEDVTVYYVEPSDISGGVFKFSVSKSWLLSNGYNINDIVLYHYNGETGEWEELITNLTGEDDGYYYYSAETPSFSWFAIAVSEGATIVPKSATVQATQTPAAVATPASSAAATASVLTGDAGISVDSKNYGSLTSLALPVLVVVLAIIVIAGIVLRKRKKEYPDWWNKEFK